MALLLWSVVGVLMAVWSALVWLGQWLLTVLLGNQLGPDFYVYGFVGTIIAALKYWRD